MMNTIVKLFSSKKKTTNAYDKNNSAAVKALTKEIFVRNSELEKLLGFKYFNDNTKIREDLTDAEINHGIELYIRENLIANKYMSLFLDHFDSLDFSTGTPSFDELFPVEKLQNLYLVATNSIHNFDKCIADYMATHTTREEKMITLRKAPNVHILVTAPHMRAYEYAMTNHINKKVAELAAK